MRELKSEDVRILLLLVIPAKAGIQGFIATWL